MNSLMTISFDDQPCILNIIPAFFLTVSEDLTKDEKRVMMKEISDIIENATGVENKYHMIVIYDNVTGCFGGDPYRKIAVMKIYYIAFTPENQAALSKQLTQYLKRRGFDPERIHIIFKQQKVENYAFNVQCD